VVAGAQWHPAAGRVHVANFRFSYTKFIEFLYGFIEFLYAPSWFALELGLEGPPGLLADGRLLPNA